MSVWMFFDEQQRQRLFNNVAEAMNGIPDFIIERQMGHFEKVHPDYAAGVREAMKTVIHKTRQTQKEMDRMALDAAE